MYIFIFIYIYLYIHIYVYLNIYLFINISFYLSIDADWTHIAIMSQDLLHFLIENIKKSDGILIMGNFVFTKWWDCVNY